MQIMITMEQKFHKETLLQQQEVENK